LSAEGMIIVWNDLTPRQRHVQKLKEIEAEYQTATGYRRKDLQRCIQRMIRELRAYDHYTNRDGWIR
jgi:hypothetical protein